MLLSVTIGRKQPENVMRVLLEVLEAKGHLLENFFFFFACISTIHVNLIPFLGLPHDLSTHG